VIPTVGRLEVLGRVLDRLERQGPEVDQLEVVVVHPETADLSAVARTAPDRAYTLRLLHSQRANASSQRNIGWRSVSAPLVLFIGDDTLPSVGFIRAHLDAHAQQPRPEVGVLGRIMWSGDSPVTPFMRWLEHGIQFDYRGLAAGGDAGWWRFYTANVSVKRAMLERVGGFDEDRFPFLYEDLDLAARMSRLGFRLTYEPSACVEHDHPQTLAGWRQRVRRIAVAERRFCERYPQAKPYFYDLFSDALAAPPARRRRARLAAMVPPGMPWLGPRVWASFDLWHRQQLAPEFLAAWRAAEGEAHS